MVEFVIAFAGYRTEEQAGLNNTAGAANDSVEILGDSTISPWQDPRFSGTRIWIKYRDSNYSDSERFIRIYSIEQAQFADYIHAFCELRQEDRTFKIDNILEVVDVHGEVHDAKDFFHAFISPPPTGRSSGPSRHSAFGKALKLVDMVADEVRILCFLAEFDGKFGNKEAEAIMAYVQYQARQSGLELTKRDLTDFRLWMKMLHPTATSMQDAIEKVAKKGELTADDLWQLAEIVLGADNKLSKADMAAAAVLRDAINEIFYSSALKMNPN